MDCNPHSDLAHLAPPPPRSRRTTLPGTLPGLLRRGSPVLLHTATHPTAPRHMHGLAGTVHRVAKGMAMAIVDGPDQFQLYALGTLDLDLTDPTGRVHAEWWVGERLGVGRGRSWWALDGVFCVGGLGRTVCFVPERGVKVPMETWDGALYRSAPWLLGVGRADSLEALWLTCLKIGSDHAPHVLD